MFSVLFKLKWFFKENRKRYTVALILLDGDKYSCCYSTLADWAGN